MSAVTQLLIGTRKGAWVYRDDGERGDWRVHGPLFLGQIINHFVQDPRDPAVQLIAAKTGAPLHEVASRAEEAWRSAHGQAAGPPPPVIGDDRSPA